MKLESRPFARTNVRLSPITLGSMRLHEHPHLDDDGITRLLAASLELGVTTIHVSTEYDSHPLFLRALRRLGARPFQFVAKLAEPHFGDLEFSRERLVAKVEGYLHDLGSERLDVVQWMWRGDLKNEADRLQRFRAASAEISDAFAELRTAGKIGAVAPFPYTPAFAELVIDLGWDGLAVYLNPLEQEYLPQILRAAAAGSSTIAIRPLAATKALASVCVDDCVRSVLSRPGVATAVVSYSSIQHLEELTSAARARS